MAIQIDRQQILIDDGLHYIAFNPNHSNPRQAPGQLCRRCAKSVRTPYGYDCVGEFLQQGDGSWVSYIDAPDPDAGDKVGTLMVNAGVERIQAICALWRARNYSRGGSEALWPGEPLP